MAQNTSGQRLGLMENAMAMQQIKESNERIENSKSERGKRDGVDTEQGWATIENIMQDTQNKELEEKLTEQKTINMQLQNVTEIDRAEALIKQANANTSKIAQDTSIDAETRKDVVKARMLENLETEARILERKTNVTMSKAQMQNMIDNVLVARQNADANDDKNALEVTRQTLMKELKQMDIDQRWWEMWVKAGSTAISDLLGLIPNVNKIFKTITTVVQPK
jgi:Glu-tRNA(Gln) amidotransferase subunit E-like FAD-binding protein